MEQEQKLKIEEDIVKMLKTVYDPELPVRGDYQSRMSGYSVGIQNGFLSPNDVRELENMDLIPDELGGNRYLCNGNMIDIGSAGRSAEPQENTYNNETESDTENEE